MIIKEFIIYFLAFVDFSIFYLYLAVAKNKSLWVLPFTLFNTFFLIEYPIKAIYLANILFFGFKFANRSLVQVKIPYSYDNLLIAFLYSTIFYLIFNIITIHFLKYAKKVDIKDLIQKSEFKLKNLTITLWLIVLLVFMVKLIYINIFYGFGNTNKYNFFEIMVSNLSDLEYLTIFLLLVLYKIYNDKKYLFMSLFLIFIVIFAMIISTSKAPLIILMIILILYLDIFRIKVSKKTLLLLSLLVLGIFADFFYSYGVRKYGLIFGNNISINSVYYNFNLIIHNFNRININIISTFLNRISWLDNLIYLMKRTGHFNKSFFAFGSFVGVLDLIPRFVWHNRPNFKLSYFIVRVIQGEGLKNVSSNFGRIGESFLILEYGGIIFAIINSVLFFFIYHEILQRAIYRTGSLFLFILYFEIYFSYFIGDNYIFQNFVNIFYSSIFLWLLVSLMPNKRIVLNFKIVKYSPKTGLRSKAYDKL